MRASGFVCLVLLSMVSVASVPLAAQSSIEADGNVETDAQLVSNVATGTAPLAVSSTTMVTNLNADQVDGLEGTDLASMLLALEAQVDALGLALVPRTGQTTCYDAEGGVTTCGTGIGLGQDGDLVMGVQWPNPRFTDNGNGTVTDNLTGLIWLDDADCFGTTTWPEALTAANGLFDGSTNDPLGGDCGLTDGSLEGAWRLPNLRELQSLAHYGVSSPAVPNTAGTGQWSEGDPFSGVQLAFYWSSTTRAGDTITAWGVEMASGFAPYAGKYGSNRFWPVRGGQ